MEATAQKTAAVSDLPATVQSAIVGHIYLDRKFAHLCLSEPELFRTFTNALHSSILKAMFELLQEIGKVDLAPLKIKFEEMWSDLPTRSADAEKELKRCVATAKEYPLSQLEDQLAILRSGAKLAGFLVNMKKDFGAKLSDADKLISNPKELDKVRDGVIELHKTLTDPKFRQHKFNLKPVDERKRLFKEESKSRLFALENKVPFLSPVFDDIFYLTKGLTLIGGMPGRGKSTTVANILARFIEETDKIAIVISNEENRDGVYGRTACCMLGESFVRYYNNQLSPETNAAIEKHILSVVIPRIEVVTGRDDGMDTLENVIDVLERTAASDRPVGLVLIDYYQTVQISKTDRKKTSVEVLKDFGFYLKDYGIRSTVPIVNFVQLKSDAESTDFADRVQNDRTIYNHAENVIEIRPDFETKKTTFRFHKGRFLANQNDARVLAWNFGRYEAVDYSQVTNADEDVVKG